MSSLASFLRAATKDPRHYQIAVLSGLLVFGGWKLGFDVRAENVVPILAGTFGTQALGTRLARLSRLDFRSAAISAASLCLLLRTSSPGLALIAAVIAVGSKFVLRFRGKHLFNPTNIGIVAVLLVTDRAWVSPGQWGSVAYLAFLFACLGGLVVNRAARSDVTYAFLAFYAAFVFRRSMFFHDPITIPIHRLEGGAILLFAFFMISDPKTTPSSRAGRIIFAFFVAAVAAYGRFCLFEPNALLYALALATPLVPFLDWALPGPLYDWKFRSAVERPNTAKGSSHATLSSLDVVGSGLAGRHAAPGAGVLRVLRRQS